MNLKQKIISLLVFLTVLPITPIVLALLYGWTN